MRILVTGSAGHLGEALMRNLEHSDHEALGLDVKNSPFTHRVGSIKERGFVKECVRGVDVVLHTATLHKRHLASHSRQDFVDTNITGTLNLLEEAAAGGIKAFIYTSTTSVFGRALSPPAGAPAAWITEDVIPIPKNIYGVTKLAGENLCELVHAKEHRRADIEDVVGAHLLAMQKASMIGFGRYIISATTLFTPDDRRELRSDVPAVVRRYAPGYETEYQRRGWSMVPAIDRVYVNELARAQLGWQPVYDFNYVIQRLRASEDFRSPLAMAVGSKGYHAEVFSEGPYPI